MNPLRTEKVNDDPVFFNALTNVMQHAYTDTGGGGRCASFLLSLWNGSEYKMDMQDFLYIDEELHAAMILILRHIYDSSTQLDTYVSEQQMAPIMTMWGDAYRTRKGKKRR